MTVPNTLPKTLLASGQAETGQLAEESLEALTAQVAVRGGSEPGPQSLTAALAGLLADAVVQALVWEVSFSPKPGLVDARSSGAHEDADLALFLRSAHALRDSFAVMAAAGLKLPVGSRLREAIGAAGRDGETAMFAVTGGVNTHKGAIWSLGLLVTATAGLMSEGRYSCSAALDRAGQLARIPDGFAPMGVPLSHGQEVSRRYALSGARGEAAAGFPQLRQALGLAPKQQSGSIVPVARSRRGPFAGDSEDGGNCRPGTDPDRDAWLRVLLSLCAHVTDTNIVHRSDPATLVAFQAQAQAILDDPRPVLANPAYDRLQAFALDRHISPGGSADLFAAARFLTGLTEIADSVAGQVGQAVWGPAGPSRRLADAWPVETVAVSKRGSRHPAKTSIETSR